MIDPQPKLSIVIVNWNGGELLLQCLQSIRESNAGFGLNVFVVDNNSKDGSRELAAGQFPEFTVFNSGANLGFGRANNLARSRIDTPMVLFLNPDTELRPDTLGRVVDCLEAHPEVGMLGCKMLDPSGQTQPLGVQWFPSPWTILAESFLESRLTRRWFRRWLPVVDPMQSGYVQKLYGGFLLARREVLDRAGWFDDRYFMYAEDVDLCRTIADLGWKLYYCAEAEVVHVAGGTSRKAPSGFSVLMKQESIGRLMRKYHGRIGAALFRGLVAVGAAFRFMLLLVAAPFWWMLDLGSSMNWRASLTKQVLLLSWAVGLQKASRP